VAEDNMQEEQNVLNKFQHSQKT